MTSFVPNPIPIPIPTPNVALRRAKSRLRACSSDQAWLPALRGICIEKSQPFRLVIVVVIAIGRCCCTNGFRQRFVTIRFRRTSRDRKPARPPPGSACRVARCNTRGKADCHCEERSDAAISSFPQQVLIDYETALFLVQPRDPTLLAALLCSPQYHAYKARALCEGRQRACPAGTGDQEARRLRTTPFPSSRSASPPRAAMEPREEGRRSGKRNGWLGGSRQTTFTSGTRPLGSNSPLISVTFCIGLIR